MDQAASINTTPFRRDANAGLLERLDPILDAKVPVAELAVLGAALSSPILYYFIQSIPHGAPLLGYQVLNCSESDFLMNNLFGLEAFYALFLSILLVIPALTGTARLVRKKKWGGAIMGATLLLGAWNGWLTYASLEWFWTTSNRAIIENAEQAVTGLAAAQKAYKAEHGAYAADAAALGGSYGFSEIGTVAITAASAQGFSAEARHSCLVKSVRFDTKTGLVTK